MFPSGWPGLALLALRASVAMALMAENFGFEHMLSAWLLGAGIVVAAALCVGWFTPIAAFMALAFHVWTWWSIGNPGAVALSIVALDALALSLLGPGAYSVDSYRFGRRVVVVPPR